MSAWIGESRFLSWRRASRLGLLFEASLLAAGAFLLAAASARADDLDPLRGAGLAACLLAGAASAAAWLRAGLRPWLAELRAMDGTLGAEDRLVTSWEVERKAALPRSALEQLLVAETGRFLLLEKGARRRAVFHPLVLLFPLAALGVFHASEGDPAGFAGALPSGSLTRGLRVLEGTLRSTAPLLPPTLAPSVPEIRERLELGGDDVSEVREDLKVLEQALRQVERERVLEPSGSVIGSGGPADPRFAAAEESLARAIGEVQTLLRGLGDEAGAAARALEAEPVPLAGEGHGAFSSPPFPRTPPWVLSRYEIPARFETVVRSYFGSAR